MVSRETRARIAPEQDAGDEEISTPTGQDLERQMYISTPWIVRIECSELRNNVIISNSITDKRYVIRYREDRSDAKAGYKGATTLLKAGHGLFQQWLHFMMRKN